MTNFFAIAYNHRGSEPVGATGGGYILSKGVLSRATLLSHDSALRLDTVVDGNAGYDARTTRRAVELLRRRAGVTRGHLLVEQRMEIPVGYGFGASSASAISAAYATAAALGLGWSRERVAKAAYDAEIIEKTGLGTVSAAYHFTGAGAIAAAGAPGVARFVEVKLPREFRLVTASLRPYDKTRALSSAEMSARISDLGNRALTRFLASPSIDTLGSCGELYSSRLGLMMPDLRELTRLAKAAGATYASQNMIGDAIHAVADSGTAQSIAASLRKSKAKPAVRTYRLCSRGARVLSDGRGATPAGARLSVDG